MSLLRACVILLLGAIFLGEAKAAEPTPQWLSDEIYCVARVIYVEARGLSEREQYGVAYSVMNRKALNRRDFGGDTACGVAFHLGQYDGIKGKLNDPWQPKDWDAWFLSLTRAWRVYVGKEIPYGEMRKALYYLNPAHSSQAGKSWFERNLRPLHLPGVHRFYAER